MLPKTHPITIKGTRDGLTFILDDSCAFGDLLKELEEKMTKENEKLDKGRKVPVRLETGYRYLTASQREAVREVISKTKNLYVEQISASVVTKQEAEAMKNERCIHRITRIVRSGQVLEVTGDLVLAGDVNPTGTVRASGNIFILGALRGAAHAGCQGREDAVIAASVMQPSRLKIAGVSDSAGENHRAFRSAEMECAYIDEENRRIILDRLQNLYRIRPGLRTTV